MDTTSFFKRPLAITDLEMTGLDPSVHEIIEIGLVLVDQDTFEIKDTLNVQVKPEHIGTASPEALVVNGYKAEDWNDAIPLKEALQIYAEKTRGAVFCGQVVSVDWGFLAEGFRKTGVVHSMDYHQVDVPSIAWAKLRHTGIEKVKLSALCKYFGIPEEPQEHRAINGAMKAYEVLKKLI